MLVLNNVVVKSEGMKLVRLKKLYTQLYADAIQFLYAYGTRCAQTVFGA